MGYRRAAVRKRQVGMSLRTRPSPSTDITPSLRAPANLPPKLTGPSSLAALQRAAGNGVTLAVLEGGRAHTVSPRAPVIGDSRTKSLELHCEPIVANLDHVYTAFVNADPPASPNHSVANPGPTGEGIDRAGYTRVVFRKRMTVAWDSGAMEQGGVVPTFIRSVNVFYTLDPIEVYVSSNYPNNSCPYRVTLAHEQGHVWAFLRIFHEARASLVAALEAVDVPTISRPERLPPSDVEARQDAIGELLRQVVLVHSRGVTQRMNADRATRDSIAAYEAEYRRCPPEQWSAQAAGGAPGGAHFSELEGDVDLAAALHEPARGDDLQGALKGEAELGCLGALTLRQPLFFSARPPPNLAPQTPAWAHDGHVHIGVPVLSMSPTEKAIVFRHELAHRLQQRLSPQEETPMARHTAEAIAHRAETNQRLELSDLLTPVPGLLGFPSQTHSPWTRVWIGHGGLVGEVIKGGVCVRIFKSYDELGITNMPGYQAYHCGKHDKAPIPTIVKKMGNIADTTAKFNAAIPAGAPERIRLVTITNETSGYRMANGAGLMVIEHKEFTASSYVETAAHEASHAIFEHHSVAADRAKREADPLAQRIADLFVRLEGTKPVPIPTSLFNPRRPPSLKIKPDESAQPAGLVMVMDTLWSGTGGHPWDGADEFFASSLAAFVHKPALLRQIVAYYQKADSTIKVLAPELFRLLAVAVPGSTAAPVSAPSSTAPALAELATIGAPPDFSGKGGQIGWLIDPTTLPSPQDIRCPASASAPAGTP
jgi:hypothetical protein